MSHPTRKYGARIDNPTKPALAYAAFRAVTPVPHPDAVDYTDPGWAMLGNDVAGDCEAVRWANNRRHVVKYLLGSERYATQADVWTLYKTQNPGFVPGDGPHGYESNDDQGMDTQTLAEHLHANGGPDGVKAAFFAKVDHTKTDEVAAAIATFGGVWVDISVTAANQDEFDQGTLWDYVKGSPLDGYHAVYAVGYREVQGGVQMITWAAETGFTDLFWAHQVQQVFVVAWPEHFGAASFETGVNRDALAAAYFAETGKTLVLPPLPGPTPDPAPTPPAPPTPGPVASFPGSAATGAELARLGAEHGWTGPDAWVKYVEYRFPGDKPSDDPGSHVAGL